MFSFRTRTPFLIFPAATCDVAEKTVKRADANELIIMGCFNREMERTGHN